MRFFCFVNVIVLCLAPRVRGGDFAQVPGTTTVSVQDPGSTTAIHSLPLPQLAQRIATADRVVVTNDSLGATPYGFSIGDKEVGRIVKAVSGATRERDQQHPDFEWEWQLHFYAGTNFLVSVRIGRDSFLADGVCLDSSGVLERLYRDTANREYVARVYGDEEKEVAKTTKVEARQWLKSSLHTLQGENSGKVAPYVDRFYAAGAPTVYLAGLRKPELGSRFAESATHLLVALPQDPEVRRKVFLVHEKAVHDWGIDADGDVGQKYLWYGVD